VNPKLQAPNPKPRTQNPKAYTLYPKTPHPKPYILNQDNRFVAFTVKSYEAGAEDSPMLYIAFNAHHLPAKVDKPQPLNPMPSTLNRRS